MGEGLLENILRNHILLNSIFSRRDAEIAEKNSEYILVKTRIYKY